MVFMDSVGGRFSPMIKTIVTPSEKKKTLEAFKLYLKLSNLLFNRRREEIYNVTDIPEDSEFYPVARSKAAELKINWEKMTHSQSNRIMLAVLEDSFNGVRDVEESENILLTLKLRVDERKN